MRDLVQAKEHERHTPEQTYYTDDVKDVLSYCLPFSLFDGIQWSSDKFSLGKRQTQEAATNWCKMEKMREN